jgi:hypothetical protein
MVAIRKARTVSFRRSTALSRAESSTKLEGGRVAEAQRSVIRAYQDGTVEAGRVLETVRRQSNTDA